MIDLTQEAKEKFDEYMRNVRRSFGGSEVEQSVREHIEAALTGVPAPVGAASLTQVLSHLGSPEQWVADEERPSWRRVIDRLMRGPEDWRLAYLTFTLTMVALALLPIGGMLLLIPAYLLARAHVDLMTEHAQPLGARRWLVLPPIAILAFLIVSAAVVAPIAGFAAWGLDQHGFDVLARTNIDSLPVFDHARIVAGWIGIATGVWWLILAGLIAIFVTPFRVVIAPLANRLRRVHAVYVAAAGVVVGIAGAALLLLG